MLEANNRRLTQENGTVSWKNLGRHLPPCRRFLLCGVALKEQRTKNYFLQFNTPSVYKKSTRQSDFPALSHNK
jgi:hypothetical protein